MATQTSLSSRAWIELLLLAILWGASFLAFAIALDTLGVASVVAVRVGLGALTLWCLVRLPGIRIPRGLAIWAALAVMGLLNNVIPFLLIAWGQTTIESGLTAILNGTTALFAVLLAPLFLADERLTPNRAAGIALGLLGVAIAVGIDALRNLDLRSLAQLAILAAAVSYAFAGIWARKTLKGLDPKSAALGMLTASTVITLPLALVVDGPPPGPIPSEAIIALLYLAIAATAVAYLLYYRVLAMAGPANLMLVTLLITPIAILLGALVRAESLSLEAVAGFLLIGLGLLVIDGRLARRLFSKG